MDGTFVSKAASLNIQHQMYTRHRPFHDGRLAALLLGSGDGGGGTAAAAGALMDLGLIRSKGVFWLAGHSDRAGEWQHAGSLFRFSDGGAWLCAAPGYVAPGEACTCKTCAAEAAGGLGAAAWRGDRRQEVVLIGPDLQVAKVVALLDGCLLTPDEMHSRTDAAGAADTGGQWWAGLPGSAAFPAWEGSEEAAVAAEANADALQAVAFDALMTAQDVKDDPSELETVQASEAADAAKEAVARADAAQARAAELKVAAVRVEIERSAAAEPVAASAPVRKKKATGGGGCCGSRPKPEAALEVTPEKAGAGTVKHSAVERSHARHVAGGAALAEH